jgi:predicted small lipoprotein YifL
MREHEALASAGALLFFMRYTIQLALCVAAVMLGLLGCGKKEPALAPADQSYVVRARLVSKPTEGSYLTMHHAEIPEFKNQTGATVGMKEMVMEFAELTPGAAAELAGIAVGDGVEVAFEVRWKSDPRMLVTKLTKLAPEAELGLKKQLDAGE